MIDQGTGDFVILDDIEEAEKANRGMMIFVEAPVDGSRDTPGRLPVFPSHEVGDLGISVIWVFRCKQTFGAEYAGTE